MAVDHQLITPEAAADRPQQIVPAARYAGIRLRARIQGAITSKIKHAIKHKTSPTRLAQLLQPSLAFCPGRYAVIGCKLKQNANEGCKSCALYVQVLQDLFYVLLYVLFYL